MDRGKHTDRFGDDEERKRSEEGLRRAGSSSRRERDRTDRQGRAEHDPVHVSKKREEVHVERIPAEEGEAPKEIEVRDDEVLIPVVEEEVVVEKRPVVKEVLRIRKDIVEDEESVDVEVPEKDKGDHRHLEERARGGSHESTRRASSSREEDRDRSEMSFIDKAREALSGEDKRDREETRTRGETPLRRSREDEPPRTRR